VTWAITVRLSSRGPVVFHQARIGRERRAFTMLNFRTLVDHADEMHEQLGVEHSLEDPMSKPAGEPRVTSVGRFLRRRSLNEVPQLFDALNGSMSKVGPRSAPSKK
jgi:lipopolysaccharide/colanic/teichoic acid biosynthesis glycosyltransferase